MRHITRTFAGMAMLSLGVAPLSAQGNSGNAPGQSRARPEQRREAVQPETSAQGRVIFRDRDRENFQSYLERGLVVVKPLPPGIQAQLERGRPLPPGIERTRLSPALVRIAPRLPRGYSYWQVGESVVVVDGRNRVVDMLADVFR